MKRVIFAEDDQHITMLVEFCLEDIGCELETFNNGATAYERIQAGPEPDLVMLDLQMPGMNGLEILTALKADPKRSHIPVLIVSARAKDADRTRAIEYGASAYLTKPFDTNELCDKVRTLSAPGAS